MGPISSSSPALSSPVVDFELVKKACLNGDVATIKKFIKEGRSFNVVNSQGFTPLMVAALCKSDKVFNKVLAQTSEEYLHKVDHKGMNVLFFACESNKLSRVTTLKDKGVKVIRNVEEELPSEMTTNEEIRLLLFPDSEALEHMHGLILTEIVEKHKDVTPAAKQELYERTGRRMVKNGNLILLSRNNPYPIAAIVDGRELGTEEFKKSLLQHPRTQQEIRGVLKEQVPYSTSSASKQINNATGITVAKKETRELLAQAEVTPKKDLLNDKNVRREIGNYFKENRPKSVQEAIDYIKDKYQVTCQPKHIIPFLAYFGITFEPSPKVEPSDVD